MLRTLAEAESAGGEFAAAASDWKKLSELLPNDPQILNSLGYARGWAGDYAGAMAALQHITDSSRVEVVATKGELEFKSKPLAAKSGK